MLKMINDWYSELPEVERVKAFFETHSTVLLEKVKSLPLALSQGFDWNLSKDGRKYWSAIYEREVSKNTVNSIESTFTSPFNTHYVKGPLDEIPDTDLYSTKFFPYPNHKVNDYIPVQMGRLDQNLGYTPENTKKIIGYKSPHYLFKGRIKKGSIFSEYSSQKLVMYNKDYMTSGVATEIVQTWEPVYEEKPSSVVLRIGKPHIDVTISANRTIRAEKKDVPWTLFNILVRRINGQATNRLPWSVSYPVVTIGCSDFTKDEINKVWSTFAKLNNILL